MIRRIVSTPSEFCLEYDGQQLHRRFAPSHN
jgi:hypothetical protein